MLPPVTMSDPLHICEIFSSIQGEGLLAGYRQIFIRLAGCNLDCDYCDTAFEKTGDCRVETRPGSASFDLLPQPLSLNTLLDILKGWLSALPGAHHSASITGGEPLLSAGILKLWLPEIQSLLPVHLETNGTLCDELEEVIQHVDYISMDMKLPSTSGSRDLWDLHHLFLQKARTKKVSVKIVVGNDTDIAEILRVTDIIASVDLATPLFIQPMMLCNGTIAVSANHILHLQELASRRLPDVRVIPQMHKLLGAL